MWHYTMQPEAQGYVFGEGSCWFQVVIAQCDSNLGHLPSEHYLRLSFWRWLKAKVYGATAFDTIDDVISKVVSLLAYHEGWRTSTIHLDFTDYHRS